MQPKLFGAFQRCTYVQSETVKRSNFKWVDCNIDIQSSLAFVPDCEPSIRLVHSEHARSKRDRGPYGDPCVPWCMDPKESIFRIPWVSLLHNDQESRENLVLKDLEY